MDEGSVEGYSANQRVADDPFLFELEVHVPTEYWLLTLLELKMHGLVGHLILGYGRAHLSICIYLTGAVYQTVISAIGYLHVWPASIVRDGWDRLENDGFELQSARGHYFLPHSSVKVVYSPQLAGLAHPYSRGKALPAIVNHGFLGGLGEAREEHKGRDRCSRASLARVAVDHHHIFGVR